jgi:hypothetical protein
MDKDNDGSIDFNEFLEMRTVKMSEQDSREEMENTYKLFVDPNSSDGNSITLNKLREISQKIGEDMTDAELKEMLEGVTRGGIGRRKDTKSSKKEEDQLEVNQDDFLKLMKRAGLFRPDHVPPRVRMNRVLDGLKSSQLTAQGIDRAEKEAKSVLADLHATTSQEEYNKIRRDYSEAKESAAKRLRRGRPMSLEACMDQMATFPVVQHGKRAARQREEATRLVAEGRRCLTEVQDKNYRAEVTRRFDKLARQLDTFVSAEEARQKSKQEARRRPLHQPTRNIQPLRYPED